MQKLIKLTLYKTDPQADGVSEEWYLNPKLIERLRIRTEEELEEGDAPSYEIELRNGSKYVAIDTFGELWSYMHAIRE